MALSSQLLNAHIHANYLFTAIAELANYLTLLTFINLQYFPYNLEGHGCMCKYAIYNCFLLPSNITYLHLVCRSGILMASSILSSLCQFCVKSSLSCFSILFSFLAILLLMPTCMCSVSLLMPTCMCSVPSDCGQASLYPPVIPTRFWETLWLPSSFVSGFPAVSLSLKLVLALCSTCVKFGHFQFYV